MTIDISKIRPGDKVTLVPLEVIGLGDKGVVPGRCFMFEDASGSNVWFNDDQIAEHHPAPREFQVGDRVKSGRLHFGNIRAIDGDDAWVLWDGNSRNQGILINGLTLVEGGE